MRVDKGQRQVPFNNRVIGHLGNRGDSCDAVGRKQPDGESRMQSHSFEVQFESAAVHLKCVDSIAVGRKVVR